MAQNINPDQLQSLNSTKQNSDFGMAKDNHAVTKRFVSKLKFSFLSFAVQ